MSEANRTWIVRVKATVIKEIVAENCTEKEAGINPFQFMDGDGETELEMTDFEVLSVRPNK